MFDGDRRGNAADVVHPRLVHAVEELPHVGAERFDVTTLAFGVNGFEGQARFAAATRAGNDGQFPQGKIDIDALEIVLARSADLDAVRRGGRGDTMFFSSLRTHWKLSEIAARFANFW